MSVASPLDLARDMLSLASDAAPSEVLEAARAKQAAWEIARKEGKNPPIRNAADRNLKALLPLLPELEIEGEIHQLEADAANRASLGARRHEIKLRAGKLSTRLSALPDGDVRAIRLARLADVSAALSGPDDSELRELNGVADTWLGRAATLTPAELVTASDELSALRTRIEKLPEGSARNGLRTKHQQALTALVLRRDVLEAASVETAFEHCTAKIAEATAPALDALRAEIESFRSRIEKVPEAAGRAGLQAKLQAALAAVALRRETLDASGLDTVLQQTAARIPAAVGPALEALRAELDSLRSRIERVPESAGRANLLTRHEAAVATLAARRLALEGAALETALQQCAAKIDTAASAALEALRVELDALRARIEAVADAGARAGLQAKHAAAETALAARRGVLERGDLASAVAATVAKVAAAPAPELPNLRRELEALLGRVAKLPEGAERIELDTQLQAAIKACATRREMLLLDTAVARLAAAREAGAPEAEQREQFTELRGRIADLPESPERTALDDRLKAIFATGGSKTEVVDAPEPIETGELLRLRPVMAKTTSLRLPLMLFVARSRFVLGRYPSQPDAPVSADFSCPTTMKRISREHVILQRMGREILAQDGEATNGTWIGETRLRSNPTPLRLSPPQEILLGFGPVLTVIAHHVASAAPEGPKFPPGQNLGAFRPAPPSLLTGAVRFLPKPDMDVPALVTWIFTDAAVGSAPNNALVTTADFPPSLLRVHHWQNAFWLENLAGQFPVGLTSGGDQRVLAPGEIVPLRTGDLLHLGPANYNVSVES